jgi:hypothetical protein
VLFLLRNASTGLSATSTSSSDEIRSARIEVAEAHMADADAKSGLPGVALNGDVAPALAPQAPNRVGGKTPAPSGLELFRQVGDGIVSLRTAAVS